MISQPKSRQFLLWLFGSLYFVQGVITSYQLNFFKPHMDSAGIDANRIGLVASLALLPFILKGIFGLISDRINLFGRGHRIPYMILGVVLCSLAFFGAFFIDPAASFTGLATMVLTATFAMALFDTTADAYSVDIIPEEDHSLVQAYMTGGRAAGLIILSFIFGIMAQQFGYSSIFLVISLTLLLPLILLFQIEEIGTRSERQPFSWQAFRACIQPNILIYSVFLTLAWIAFQGIDGLVTFYMSNELGAAETTLGNYGTIKGIGMVVGAIGMGWLNKRFGRRTTGFITLIGVTLGGIAFSQTSSISAILIIGAVWGIVVGFHWTIYASISMGVVDLRIAGTMFALLGMMANIGLAIGDGLSTALSDNFGFSTVFLALGLGNLIAIPLFALAAHRFKLT